MTASEAPLTLALLLAVLAAYVGGAHGERRRGRRWSGWRVASFVTGLGAIAVALAPPMAPWAEHTLQGHMIRHLLLGMVAPLALVLGAPVTLVLRTLPVPTARRLTASLRRRPVGWLTHPATALALDSGTLYLLYLTPLYAAMHASPALQSLAHLHFLLAGSLFAWAIVGRAPSPHRAGFHVRLLVLGAAMAAHATLAKLMYAYGWPRGTAHASDEILAAAQLMYYGGDAVELLLLTVLFADWLRRRRVTGASVASGVIVGDR